MQDGRIDFARWLGRALLGVAGVMLWQTGGQAAETETVWQETQIVIPSVPSNQPQLNTNAGVPQGERPQRSFMGKVATKLVPWKRKSNGQQLDGYSALQAPRQVSEETRQQGFMRTLFGKDVGDDINSNGMDSVAAKALTTDENSPVPEFPFMTAPVSITEDEEDPHRFAREEFMLSVLFDPGTANATIAAKERKLEEEKAQQQQMTATSTLPVNMPANVAGSAGSVDSYVSVIKMSGAYSQQKAAATALAGMGDAAIVGASELLNDSRPLVRTFGVLVLRDCGSQDANTMLLGLLNDENEKIRYQANLALIKRTGMNPGYQYNAQPAERAEGMARWQQVLNGGGMSVASASAPAPVQTAAAPQQSKSQDDSQPSKKPWWKAGFLH